MKDHTLPARTDRNATLACLAIAVAGGLAWVIAAPPIGVWPLGWIALAPTLWLVDHAATPRRAALYAWTSGTVSCLGGFRWFATLLSDQAGLPLPVALLGLVLLSAYNGLVFFFAARAIRAMRRRKWPMALCAPLALVAFERLVPMVFPYYLAITQAPVPIAIQIADLAGPYAVTAALAAASGAIIDGIARRRRPGVWTAVALAACFGYGALRMHQIDAARDEAPHVKIGLISSGVQARVDVEPVPGARAQQLASLQQRSAEAEAQGASLVVWSEAAFPYLMSTHVRSDFPEDSPFRIRRGFTIPAIIGVIVGDGLHAPYNSALVVESDDTFGARHDKVHRVLGSEYNPLLETWPSLQSWMPSGASYLRAGDAPVALNVTAGGHAVHAGAMICFEDILPASSRALGALDPNLLVNLTEDSWFGPDEPWQHLGLAVFRAVEVRSDLVRAVNLGPSSHVDAVGRVVETAPLAGGGAHLLLVDAALIEGGHTVYCTVGDLFAWSCAAVTLFVWLVPWLRKRRWWRPGHAPSGESGVGGPWAHRPKKKKSVSRTR
jgi:apolipoprotein N-acyltransferase